MTKSKFTAKQLKDWVKFEKVRKSGTYNMYDIKALRASKLTPTQFGFIMDNYIELKAVIKTK